MEINVDYAEKIVNNLLIIDILVEENYALTEISHINSADDFTAKAGFPIRCLSVKRAGG